MPSTQPAARTLTDEQREVLDSSEHLLVVGRPGTGKTTVALLKAVAFASGAADGSVLFLSFSNSAVQRIRAAARVDVPRSVLGRLEFSTFHAFAYDVVRSHARLMGLPRFGGVIATHEQAMIAAEPDPAAALARLERENGRVTFERLLELTVEVLRRVPALRAAYASAYPLVIVDEYQDTTDLQDELVELLARDGQCVYLGDPDQRIYGYVPEVRADRFERLTARRQVRRITLPERSHRSAGTDIVQFGRAVLDGEELLAQSQDVRTYTYWPGNNDLEKKLRWALTATIQSARARAGPANRRISAAVLCYRNVHARRLSDILAQPSQSTGRGFAHRLVAGSDETAPAWELLLGLFEGRGESLLMAISRYARYSATKGVAAAKRAASLQEAVDAWRNGRRPKARSLSDFPERVGATHALQAGDPALELGVLAGVLAETKGGYFESVEVALRERSPVDAASLIGQIGDMWRSKRSYVGVTQLAQNFLVREQLLDLGGQGDGCVVTTLHRSKGKEYDCVVIVDGIKADSLVLKDDPAPYPTSRRLLSMAIARARFCVGIVTPGWEPCPLLPSVRKSRI